MRWTDAPHARAVRRRAVAVPPAAALALAIIAAGVFWRVWLSVHHHGFLHSDQFGYSQLALSLAAHLDFSSSASPPWHWPPGPPVAFAVGLRLFGHGDSGLAGAYITQVLISVATLLVLFVVTRACTDNGHALAATAALAVSTGAVAASADLISEPLGALLLICAVGIFALGFARASAGRNHRAVIAIGGLTLGLAILSRPDFMPLAVVCALVTALALEGRRRDRALTGLLALACTAAVVAPYSTWATARSGTLATPTTSALSTYWVGTYLPARGSTWKARTLLAAEVHRRFPSTRGTPRPRGRLMIRTIEARHPHLSHEAALRIEVLHNLRRYALGRPLAFAGMEFEKLWDMWSRPYGGHNRTRSGVGNALHVPGALAALLAVLGAAILRRRRPALLLCGAVIATATLMDVIAVGQPRANTRVLPVAFLGAALVASEVLARRRGRETRHDASPMVLAHAKPDRSLAWPSGQRSNDASDAPSRPSGSPTA